MENLCDINISGVFPFNRRFLTSFKSNSISLLHCICFIANFVSSISFSKCNRFFSKKNMKLFSCLQYILCLEMPITQKNVRLSVCLSLKAIRLVWCFFKKNLRCKNPIGGKHWDNMSCYFSQLCWIKNLICANYFFL